MTLPPRLPDRERRPADLLVPPEPDFAERSFPIHRIEDLAFGRGGAEAPRGLTPAATGSIE